MNKQEILWKGKPLSEMDKSELVQVIIDCVKIIEKDRSEHREQQLRLLELL